MARTSTDTVQLGLRIREELRLRLEKAAEKNDISLNQEMTDRLTASFRLPRLERVTAKLEITAERLERATMHAPAVTIAPDLQGDLIRAAEALVAANKAQDPTAITAAIDQVEKAISVIETDRIAARGTK